MRSGSDVPTAIAGLTASGVLSTAGFLALPLVALPALWSGTAVDSAMEAADRVESWGSENMPKMRKMVRTKPFAACALALGAGALLSAILLRR